MKSRNTAWLALMLLNTPAAVALAEEPPAENAVPAAQPQSLKSLPAQEVQEVQQALRDRGQYKGAVDGIAGPGTIAALEAFQRDRGLPTGGMTNATRFELGMKPAAQPANQEMAQRPVPGTMQANPAAAAEPTQPSVTNTAEVAKLDDAQIRELQQRLVRLGYLSGEIDGKFGATTRTALSRFYSDQAELARQGRITLPGAMALGLNPADVQPVSGKDQPARMRDIQ